MKKFLCLFPRGRNIELVKDVGMIPFMLQKEGYYKSYIAFYKDMEELPYLKTEVKGLNYLRVSQTFKNEEWNIFLFMLRHLFTFDVIMMFHPNFKKLFFAFIIKLLSFGKVKFYFKMDVDEGIYKEGIQLKSLKNKISAFLSSKIDLFTVESKEINNFLNTKTYIKTKWLPNGFYKKDSEQSIHKENIILTVGRIGTHQKDTETLLRAIEKIDLQNWKVRIVGPIEEGFQKTIDTFYLSNPLLKDKVIFVGNITNRAQLSQEYTKAKIFVLTSRYEGFPLVFLEAISHGCYIISTALAPAKDITDNEKYGCLFPIEDDHKLSEIFESIINSKKQLPAPEELVYFADTHFRWENIVKTLYEYLNLKQNV